MKREDDQELWDLLGKTSQPTLSPFFARNILREIRQERTWRGRLAQWLGLRQLIPATAVAVALFATAISFRGPAVSSPSENLPEGITQLNAEDYEVVADLDDLLALEEDNLWADNDSSTL